MATLLRDLLLRQMDDTLARWRQANLPLRPKGGWGSNIREALSMPVTALAKRLKMSSAGVYKLEKSEANDTITLASLRKLADALGCELQYALVPKIPLEQMVKERAWQVVRERLKPASHTMALEDQAVEGDLRQVYLASLVEELLRGSRRGLW